jgi:hypothetical protein
MPTTTRTTETTFTLAMAGGRTNLRDLVHFTPRADGTVEVVAVTRDRLFPTGPVTTVNVLSLADARAAYRRRLNQGFTKF